MGCFGAEACVGRLVMRLDASPFGQEPSDGLRRYPKRQPPCEPAFSDVYQPPRLWKGHPLAAKNLTQFSTKTPLKRYSCLISFSRQGP